MAVHTLAKRIVEAGKKDYTLDAQRNGIDIYEMIEDPIKGFVTKTIGFMPSEKITGFRWSGAGNIFNVFESEGAKSSIQFYMISVEETQALVHEKAVVQKVKGSVSLVQKKTNKLGSSEEKYEFKKTASYMVQETKFDCAWDQTGRYLAVYGEKRSPLDKTDKSIKFFNIFGEQIAVYESLQNLLQFRWRPRPIGLLSAKELAKVKQEYKTKYNKLFKEEEKSEKKQITSKKQDAKKKVRDEFLS